MAENYFPRAEDFDEMGDHLEMIANILTNKVEIDTSDWVSIQKAVRMGVAPEVLPVGTQLTVTHSVYGDIKLDVVAHDHYETADVEGGHSMTLMCHDIITQISFDEPEAFYYAEEELPAGTYHFFVSQDSSVAGQFTLDQPLAKGGVLRISGNPNYSIDSSQILAFDHPVNQAIPRTYSIVVGSDGTNLGTLGVELNHKDRVFYGSNNYKESAIRQFLNSSAEAGKVWSSQTKFDLHPTWLDGLAGFANGFSDDLLSKIGRVVVPCRANTIYESPDSSIKKGQMYAVIDRFFLPSRTEVFGSAIPVDESTLLPFFENASDTDRVKYFSNSPFDYWLRTSTRDMTHFNQKVGQYGLLINSGVSSTLGIAPMFNIV